MSIATIVIIAITTLIVPALVMELLAPELERRAPRQKNYRGKEVWHGLGIAWALWILGVWVGGIALGAVLGYSPSWVHVVTAALPLMMGACLFGLFDDWIGANSRDKGFSGHISALAELRLTTGFLKLIGIGLLSVVTAAGITAPLVPSFESVGMVLLRAAIIALSANLMNLFDLRPTRSLKVYSLGLIVLFVFILVSSLMGRMQAADLFLVLCSFAPVLTIWRFDAAERGILGDAGANTMGAYLGFLFAVYLPLPALLLVGILLLALNLLSERYSFTQIIEGSKVLRAIDQWGRRQ